MTVRTKGTATQTLLKSGPWDASWWVYADGYSLLKAGRPSPLDEHRPEFPYNEHPPEEADVSPYGRRLDEGCDIFSRLVVRTNVSRWAVPIRDRSTGETELSLAWLVISQPFSESNVRLYDPLEVVNLHRHFAKVRIDHSYKAVVGFARRYGFLTEGLYVATPDMQTFYHGEPLAIWMWEIARMRGLLEVWDLVRQRDTWLLGEHIKPEGRLNLPTTVNWPGLPTWTTPAFRRPLESHEESVLVVAVLYVHELINRYLRFARPLLSPSRRGRVSIQPSCLLLALYAHAALEIARVYGPAVECEGCGSYFVPQHGLQKYCEPACRKKRWYHSSPHSPKVSARQPRPQSRNRHED